MAEERKRGKLRVILEGTQLSPSPDFDKTTDVSFKMDAWRSKVGDTPVSIDISIPPVRVPKPAILPSSGTVGNVPVMERPKPLEKTTTLRPVAQNRALPVSSRIVQNSRLNTSDFVSLASETASQAESDVGYLVNEALEISRQVDEAVLRHHREGALAKSKKKTTGRTAKGSVSDKTPKDISGASLATLYETDQTRLVDSLISQLKQSATGVLLSDTDLKIRDVTKQIAQSLGILPEELDPELFAMQVNPEIVKKPATPGDVESESMPVETIPEETPEAPAVTESVFDEDSSVRMDSKLTAIVKTMPDTASSKASAFDLSTSRRAWSSQEDLDEIDDLEELGQLANLPEVVTTADVLHVAGRNFKMGNLAQLEKGDDTVETGGRLEKILEQQPVQHHVEDGRVHIHELCFDDPKSEGLLPNELQQVAFETHVRARFTRHLKEDVQDDRPSWYQTAVQEVRAQIAGQEENNGKASSSLQFGGMRNVPYVNVDDALYIPGLNEWRDQHKFDIENDAGNNVETGVAGAGLQVPKATGPRFPTFGAGPSLLGLTPAQARKQLFPRFESSADARIDDYLLVKLDDRFRLRKHDPVLEEYFAVQARDATSLLRRLVSKDDTSLLPRFRNRLPLKSAPPHRKRPVIADFSFPAAKHIAAKESSFHRSPGLTARHSPRFPTRRTMKRSASDSRLYVVFAGDSELSVRIKQDYKQAMLEVELHRTLCKQLIAEKKEAAEREAAEQAAAIAKTPSKAAESIDIVVEESEIIVDEDGVEIDRTLLSEMEFVEQKRKVMTPSDAELALWGVRPSHTRKLARPLKQRRLDTEKMEWIKTHLATVPKMSRRSRRQSAPPTMKVEYKFHHPPFGPRSSSPGAVLDFEEFALKNGMKPTDIPREWVRAIWDVWFDEVIPPLEAFTSGTNKPPQDASAALAESLAVLLNTEKKAAEVPEEVVEVVETLEIFDLEIPLPEDELEQEKVFIMMEEVDRLTGVLTTPIRPVTKAINLCRRGALYRKLGKLLLARTDLNAALELQPNFVDALWHRHFILLVENRIQDAISDLNIIVRSYRFHPGAYMSRAAIYTAREDILEAIDDYGMAIRSVPQNAEAYFLRAKLYERKGEPLLAMEDYMRANQLMPHDTTALLCHAMHYIKTGNNLVAIQDLSQILERDPTNPSMYLLRGKCLSKMGRHELACADFSASLFLNPNDPEPYFQRGCLLRKLYPDRALLDFSISLLLDSSHDNIRSLLHRGILYFEIGLDVEAEADFEHILHIDRDHPAAHTNLGRIYLNKRQDYTRAIRRFTTALRADPTYRQAYLCRAEAHNKLKNHGEALRDFTKAIHLDPGDYSVYVHRGAVVLATGNYNLAAFCIRQATEAQKEVGQGVYQKAFVQAFLKRFDKAIEILQGSLRSHLSSVQAYIVLGKVYMKARNYDQAADCFNQAIDAMRPKREVLATKWPDETPELFYLLGICYLNLRKWSNSLSSFNDAIKLRPDFADAYFRRGVVRFALKHTRAIEDIHRALALDPKIFEAYLTRSVFFAEKKLWPLAIVNCNEVTKLYPNCIRAYVYRGAYKYFNHNYKGAIEDLSEAIRLDHNNVIALFNRACAYQAGDCIKLALRDFSTILMVESQRKTSRITCQTFVNRGLLYFNRRDYANALADFRNAANLKPRDAALVHALALCYHKQNLLKKSVVTYSKVLAAHPSFDDGYIGRANALVDYNTAPARTYAMREYMRRLLVNPMLHAARINLAICCQMTGRLHQAYRQITIVVSMLERASSSPLEMAKAREIRGVVSLQAKSFSSSFQDFSTAARYRPSAAIMNNRAVCNWLMNCREAAVKDFREGLHLDQRFSIGYFNLANVYMMNKRWEQAKDFFDRAILFGPNNETALINRAVVLTRLGDLARAFHDLKAAKPLTPRAHHVEYNRAVLHRMVRKLPEALEDIEEAIRLKPDDPDLYRFRALIRGEIGEKVGSLEDFSYATDLESYLKEIANNPQNSREIIPV